MSSTTDATRRRTRNRPGRFMASTDLFFFLFFSNIFQVSFSSPRMCCRLFTHQCFLTLTLAHPLPMEVVHPRAALLSNFEVLALLRELDADHLARAKTAIRIKKEEDATGKPTLEPHTEEVSENLRTVELEVSCSTTHRHSPHVPARQFSTCLQSITPPHTSPPMLYLSSSAISHPSPSQWPRNYR